MSRLREYARETYFRSRLARLLAARWVKDKPSFLDYSHLFSFSDTQIGPVQRDEALALFGLTRILCPKTIVEFGFQNGHSALNFLLAAEKNCQIYSFDIAERSRDIALRCFRHAGNFHFLFKSQTEFSPADIDHRAIDLCFLDASHDLDLNLKTFALIAPHLADDGVIAVHDTGTWQKKFFGENHRAFAAGALGKELGRWIDEERFQPCVDERIFVNTLLESHPEFSQIHLHSANTLRNGITLLQKTSPLAT